MRYALLFAFLVLAGCGSSGGSSPTVSTPPAHVNDPVYPTGNIAFVVTQGDRPTSVREVGGLEVTYPTWSAVKFGAWSGYDWTETLTKRGQSGTVLLQFTHETQRLTITVDGLTHQIALLPSGAG